MNIDSDVMLIVYCYDSDTVEHMTYAQYQLNNNSFIISPEWVVERITNAKT